MQPVYSDCDKEPKADELEGAVLKELEDFIHAIEVNNRMFGDNMDKSEEYEGNKVYLIAQLRQYIDRKVLEGRRDELLEFMRVATKHDWYRILKDRIKQLTDERGGDGNDT